MLFHVRDANLAEVAQPVDFRKYVPQLPENNMYFGKRAVVALTVLESFIYNTKLIPPNQVPKSFADLLDPKLKGKIASTNYQGLFGNYLGVELNGFGLRPNEVGLGVTGEPGEQERPPFVPRLNSGSSPSNRRGMRERIECAS